MKYRARILVITVCVLSFLTGILVTTIFMSSKVSDSVVGFSNNAIEYISFIISFVAFVISMVTFFAIDSVNSISSMEGNVLENEDYSISYEKMVDDYKKAKTKEEFADEVLKAVSKISKPSSCMECAEVMQDIIDNIIWFAYVDKDNEAYKELCKTLVEGIEKKVNYYGKISNNIKNTLGENLKLIQNVLQYQDMSKDLKLTNIPKLENIKSGVLKNPVAKIVYYDYLGLEYRKRAWAIVKEKLEEKNGTNHEFLEFETNTMRVMLNHDFDEEDREHCECLLECAEACFKSAQKYSNDDRLWKGYISYNLVRVQVMRYLLFDKKDKTELLKELDNVIKIRGNVLFLFSREHSYLNKMFQKEIDSAKKLKLNFKNIWEC